MVYPPNIMNYKKVQSAVTLPVFHALELQLGRLTRQCLTRSLCRRQLDLCCSSPDQAIQLVLTCVHPFRQFLRYDLVDTVTLAARVQSFDQRRLLHIAAAHVVCPAHQSGILICVERRCFADCFAEAGLVCLDVVFSIQLNLARGKIKVTSRSFCSKVCP